MKFISCLTVVAIFFFGMVSHSQQTFDPSGDSEVWIGPRFLRIHTEYYEVSALEYADIMSTEHSSSDDTPLRNKLLQMAKDGKAKLIETQTMSTRSGERATSESITEYIYPTEYEPPYAEHTKADKNGGEEISKNLSSSPTPTAFETRNVGATLEVEPILGEDGKTIDLTLKPEIVSLIGHSDWGTSADGKVTIQMPTFRTYRINTSITLHKGQFHMAGVFTPQDDKNVTDPTKKLLVFVKAEILNVGK